MMGGGYGSGYYGHMGYDTGYGQGLRNRYGPGYRYSRRYRASGVAYGPGWMGRGYGYCFGSDGWR
jgi:hypothetical protein